MKLFIALLALAAFLSSTAAASKSSCGPWPRPCPKINFPVCDNEGNIYPNNCQFMAHYCEKFRHPSKMKKSLPFLVTCPKKSSKPLMSKKKVEKKCRFYDEKVYKCKNGWKPVCDTDGVTSANVCEFLRRRCFIGFAEGRKVKEVNVKGGIC